jgi:uncharacterized protein with PIN domain
MAEIKFVADVMLGKLARGLRMLGVDVLYSNVAEDDEIVRIAEREYRTILTRDVGLCGRRMSARCLLIDSSKDQEQIRQVIAAFDLKEFDVFSRCLECNTPLESIPKEAVFERVPPFVYQTQERFAACPSCSRVYWQGTHVDKMRKHIPIRL